jgi:DNA-binding transcriptional LysR family regulator
MSGHIERVRVFLEVAERRSFAAAARALRLSRTIATRYVGELETELGAQLLVRTTRRVSLTAVGQAYFDRMRPLVAEMDRAGDLARATRGELGGTLRVSAPLSLGLRFLPAAATRFLDLHPEIRMRLNLTDTFVDILGEDFDMALRISGPPSDKSTIWRKICGVPRLLVASPGYLAAAGTPRVAADLARHACLGYTPADGAGRWALRNAATGEETSVAVTFRFACDNGDLIGELAARGSGVAVLPRFIVERHIREGALTPILTRWRPPEIWLTALYPPYEELPAKVEAFTRLVEEIVAADPAMLGLEAQR